MDEKFLEEWSTKLNVPIEKLKQDFEIAKGEMQSHFPNQTPEALFEKAKFKLKVQYKRAFMSNAVPFVGIVVASDAPRDMWGNIREKQMARYEKAKEESLKTGDTTILQAEFDNKVVRKAEREKDGKMVEVIIPLCPRNKSNGEPSKVAGNDIPSPLDSSTQLVYGVGTPIGKNAARGFLLELRADACNQDFKKGNIVNFKALSRKFETDSKTEPYNLYTNATEFIETDDAYLKEGLKELGGINGMILHFFSDNIASWADINAWYAAKKADPESEPIPEKYTKNLMVIPDSLCQYQNFSPDAKGRIKINICGMSDDVEDTTILCLADKKLDSSIDFAQDSKVLALGRPFLPKPKEDGSMIFMLMTSGVFAYPDWKIPRVDVEKLSEKELLQQAPPLQKQEEAKPVEPTPTPTPVPQPAPVAPIPAPTTVAPAETKGKPEEPKPEAVTPAPAPTATMAPAPVAEAKPKGTDPW